MTTASCNARAHVEERSTGQTFLLVRNDTAQVVSIRSSRESCWAIASLLREADPEFADVELVVMSNPYGGSD